MMDFKGRALFRQFNRYMIIYEWISFDIFFHLLSYYRINLILSLEISYDSIGGNGELTSYTNNHTEFGIQYDQMVQYLGNGLSYGDNGWKYSGDNIVVII